MGKKMDCIEQARRIYSLCINRNAPITYREVLDGLGYGRNVLGHAIRYGLELLLLACVDRGIPILTAIVVNQATGQPTPPGPYGVEVDNENNNWALQAQNVFNYEQWPDVNEIDWEDIYARRYEITAAHEIEGYWR